MFQNWFLFSTKVSYSCFHWYLMSAQVFLFVRCNHTLVWLHCQLGNGRSCGGRGCHQMRRQDLFCLSHCQNQRGETPCNPAGAGMLLHWFCQREGQNRFYPLSFSNTLFQYKCTAKKIIEIHQNIVALNCNNFYAVKEVAVLVQFQNTNHLRSETTI